MKQLPGMAVVVLLLVAAGCGPKVMVPPRIDLMQHEVVGIVEFSSSSEGRLGSYATGRFMEAVRRDQGMVRIVDLGPENELLEEVGAEKFDQETFQRLAETHELATVFVGQLDVSDVRPDITITPGLGFMDFSAEVDATLTVQMVETSSGASIWNGTATATKKVGGVSIFGREHFAFDAKDPDKAYGELVRALVEKVSRDFRVTWERR